jgi:altronate dehydratase large subunit
MTLNWKGYLRKDGKKGIRNYIIVAYLVECAHHVAREMVLDFRGKAVQLVGFPGCYPNAYADRMMNALCTHPMWAVYCWFHWAAKVLTAGD